MLGNIGLDNGFEGVSPLTLRGPSAEAWRSIRESEQAIDHAWAVAESEPKAL
jgi:hypothetical protein